MWKCCSQNIIFMASKLHAWTINQKIKRSLYVSTVLYVVMIIPDVILHLILSLPHTVDTYQLCLIFY